MHTTTSCQIHLKFELEYAKDAKDADDVCLISAEKLSVNASKSGINVNIPKTKVLKVNAKVNSPISLGGEDIE